MGARPPVEVIVDCIDAHREEFGVEPICRHLTVAGVPIGVDLDPDVLHGEEAASGVWAPALVSEYRMQETG